MAVDFKLTTTGNSSTFNLDDLKKHDAIEFDGSLSRNDYYFGDALHFDPAIFHTVAEKLDLYNIPISGKERFVSVETAAKATAARVRDAKQRNPSFNASANQMIGSPGTTALYLTTLWDNDADGAPKAWIKAFFGKDFLAGNWIISFPILIYQQRMSVSHIPRGSNGQCNKRTVMSLEIEPKQ